MNQYIKRHHPTIIIKTPLSKKYKVIKEQLQQLYVQVKGTEDIDEFHVKVLKACLNDMVVLEALITLIVV